jgi:hypothetical protein
MVSPLPPLSVKQYNHIDMHKKKKVFVKRIRVGQSKKVEKGRK